MSAGNLIVMLDPADVYEGTSSQRHYLGTLGITPDGRKFRDGKNDGTVEVAGNLYSGAAAVAHHANIACDVARAVGATAISATMGGTAAAADLYAEGYVFGNDATGEGITYPIRRGWQTGSGHAAAGTSSVITTNLWEGVTVQVALTTSSEVTFAQNTYKNVIIHGGPPVATLVGVAPWALTASYYGWYQTGGPSAALTAGTVVIGDVAVPSTGTAGSVMPSAAFETDGPEVGNVMKVSANTEYSLLYLRFD